MSALAIPSTQTIDHALAFARKHNTGVTPDGKTFGEVIDHFFFGGDETCFLVRCLPPST